MDKINIYIDMDGVQAVYGKVDTVEDMGKPGYFRNRPVQQNVIELIEALNIDEHINLIILSGVFKDDHSAADKLLWLLDRDLGDVRVCFVPEDESKADYAVTEGLNILIDDFSKNLFAWESKGPGFVGIKFMNGINGTKGTWAKRNGITLDASLPAEDLYDRLIEISERLEQHYIAAGVISDETNARNNIPKSFVLPDAMTDCVIPSVGINTPAGIAYEVA